jgi:sulfatase modifying factor 1
MILSRFGVDLIFRRFVAPVSLFALVCSIFAADPVVSNVQAKQREGSRLVDITYDVADPDSPTLTVYLKVSSDGGKTWKGPVELVSGDVGQHIAPGTAKKLVWEAGKEMPNQFGVKYRYRIGVSDQWLVPAGMALIPAGSFQMGDERVKGYVEFKVHEVVISAFAIDRCEVSLKLWEEVKSWAGRNGYDGWGGKSFSGQDHPVHSVTWNEAVKWNNARSEKEGKIPAYYEDAEMTAVYRRGDQGPKGVKWESGYRLPTEAEWEKAARGAVTGKLYSWGTDEINPTLSNYGGTGTTTPVLSYESNGFGLFNMTGNVSEYCWDLWGSYETSDLQTNPRGPLSGSSRVVRGGSYGHEVMFSLIADRHSFVLSNYVDERTGFRSVLPAGQP